jgi:hypothetical protein
MADIRGQIERVTRDVTSGPDLSDILEMTIVGGVVGGIVGFAKGRSKESALYYAKWFAGLGVAGQYMLFHALRPVVRRGARQLVGQASLSTSPCPPGTYWDDYYSKCLPKIRGAFSPQEMPPTLADWRDAHSRSVTGVQSGPAIVGAVDRGGFRGGAGVPFGPGPWPTNHAASPQEMFGG